MFFFHKNKILSPLPSQVPMPILVKSPKMRGFDRMDGEGTGENGNGVPIRCKKAMPTLSGLSPPQKPMEFSLEININVSFALNSSPSIAFCYCAFNHWLLYNPHSIILSFGIFAYCRQSASHSYICGHSMRIPNMATFRRRPCSNWQGVGPKRCSLPNPTRCCFRLCPIKWFHAGAFKTKSRVRLTYLICYKNSGHSWPKEEQHACNANAFAGQSVQPTNMNYGVKMLSNYLRALLHVLVIF